jgi:hypothetical protein
VIPSTEATTEPKCCPKEPVRKIPRSIYEAARDVARSLFGTEAYARSCACAARAES